MIERTTRTRYLDSVKMRRVHWILLGLASFAFACSGDDSTGIDGGNDATVDAPHDSAVDATTDAKVDAAQDAGDAQTQDSAPDAPADGGTDAPTDAPDDALDAQSGTCDGGCSLFVYTCKSGQYKPCTCLSLYGGEPAPTCDAGTVTCFVDPCANKTPACVGNQCVVQ